MESRLFRRGSTSHAGWKGWGICLVVLGYVRCKHHADTDAMKCLLAMLYGARHDKISGLVETTGSGSEIVPRR